MSHIAVSSESLENGELPKIIVQESPTPMVTPSLANSNKRRGFKQSMRDRVPQKTIFLSQGETSQTNASAPVREPYTLVPPSQRIDLPRNIIVTSVDVEEGLWDESFHKETRHKTQLKDGKRNGTDEVPDTVIDNPEVVPTACRMNAGFDWARAEKGFDQYRAVVREGIVEGKILLWKVHARPQHLRSPLLTLTYLGARSESCNSVPGAHVNGR
jgi:hypothetical protein